MKKIAIVAALSLLSATAITGFAADKKSEKESIEAQCKEQAQKEHISADKMNDFVKSCVQKHTKKAEKK